MFSNDSCFAYILLKLSASTREIDSRDSSNPQGSEEEKLLVTGSFSHITHKFSISRAESTMPRFRIGIFSLSHSLRLFRRHRIVSSSAETIVKNLDIREINSRITTNYARTQTSHKSMRRPTAKDIIPRGSPCFSKCSQAVLLSYICSIDCAHA